MNLNTYKSTMIGAVVLFALVFIIIDVNYDRKISKLEDKSISISFDPKLDQGATYGSDLRRGRIIDLEWDKKKTQKRTMYIGLSILALITIARVFSYYKNEHWKVKWEREQAKEKWKQDQLEKMKNDSE